MFCRADVPSERSSVNSPARPSSRDSQSDYSNPTSFSSQEPASGKQSPIKQTPAPFSTSPEKQIQKKRSGFFSNSPFRRKSKHEKDDHEQQQAPSMAPPNSRSTWGPSSGRNTISNNPSPTRPGVQTKDFATNDHSHSPEPVDPRANFQLNVGPNVFDVASPDSRRKPQASNSQTQHEDLDPIAQALAELKGVTKQSSVRMSADRYHGLATPAPPGTPGVPSASQHTNPVASAQRGTPPPSYHDQQSIKRLDLPQPAFTSAQMQQTTRKYVGQTQDMYGSASRPGTRGSSNDVPRATSPAPVRSVSPRPGFVSGVQPSQTGYTRSASPNSYAGRPRQGNAPAANPSPTKPGYGSMNSYSRHASPNDIRRAASPQPQFARQSRPHSSAGGGGMALQLAPGGIPQDAGSYDGSQRGRNGGAGLTRPISYYGGPHSEVSRVDPSTAAGSRIRSKSVADGRQFTREGRPILHFGESFSSSLL